MVLNILGGAMQIGLYWRCQWVLEIGCHLVTRFTPCRIVDIVPGWPKRCMLHLGHHEVAGSTKCAYIYKYELISTPGPVLTTLEALCKSLPAFPPSSWAIMAPRFLVNLIPRRERNAGSYGALSALRTLKPIQWAHFWVG